ncbi:MAG TPA: hypothetical protein VGG68_07690 [Caulobacteraceae bacterium]
MGGLVVGGIAAAARFLVRAWTAAWAALALDIAVLTLALSLGRPAFWIAAVAISLMARGALWRLASDHGRLGPGGLQAGILEVRLAGVWVLAGLFLGVIGLLALVALLCSAYAVASTGRGFDQAQIATWGPAIAGRGRLLLGVVGIVGAIGFTYAAARISLAEAATVNRKRLQVLSSFALTRGRALSLAIAHLLLALPLIGLAAWGAINGANGAWAMAGGLAIGGLWLPMSVGLMAYAYDLCARQT